MQLSDRRTNEQWTAEHLRADPEFPAEWERTALGRAVAVATVRYRADHDLSQRELADRFRMTLSDISRLELGELEPSNDSLARISSALGIEFGL